MVVVVVEVVVTAVVEVVDLAVFWEEVVVVVVEFAVVVVVVTGTVPVRFLGSIFNICGFPPSATVANHVMQPSLLIKGWQSDRGMVDPSSYTLET